MLPEELMAHMEQTHFCTSVKINIKQYKRKYHKNKSAKKKKIE